MDDLLFSKTDAPVQLNRARSRGADDPAEIRGGDGGADARVIRVVQRVGETGVNEWWRDESCRRYKTVIPIEGRDKTVC